MDKRASLLGLAVACAVTAAVLTGSGCSPRSDPSGGTSTLSQKSPLEKECERELLYLDSLLESRRRSADFPPAAMAEATELRRTAMELILDEEYELALEMIDEAIALLEPND